MVLANLQKLIFDSLINVEDLGLRAKFDQLLADSVGGDASRMLCEPEEGLVIDSLNKRGVAPSRFL